MSQMAVTDRPAPCGSEATRAKLRAANLGKTLSEETKAKMSAALKGKKVSPARLAKMRARRISDEQKEKIRASLTGIKHAPERTAKRIPLLKGNKKPPRSPEHCANISASRKAWFAARREAAQHA